MALVLKDRVKETTTTTGTGTVTLAGAAAGFQSFAAVGDGNQTFYAIADATSGAWEVGVGTYTASGTTLSRTTVVSSSNAGSLVNFSAGTKDVFVTYPSSRAVYLDAAGSAVTTLDIGTLGTSTANITTANITAGTVATAPVNNTDIVNKEYADAIASGIHFHEAVALATTAALPANTYNNGTAGVGATLTGNTNGALSVDSTLTIVAERILVKNEAAGANNGVYVVTQVGSAGTPYILTRASDMDSVGTGVDQIDEGDFFLVTSGTANINTAWVQQTPPPITIGTTTIVFQQFSAPITYTAGTGLSESPTYTFNIANIGTAGTYGSASSVPVITTNAQGQVTGVTPTAIAISGAAVSGNISGQAGSVANALTAGTYLTSGGTYNGSAARTFAVDATDANTASKVVARDASGNFSAGTITATLSGSATSATTATNLAGGAANRIAYQTSAGISNFITAPTASNQVLNWNGSAFTWSAGTISGVALGSNLNTLTFGTYLTGTSYNGSSAVTLATNATNANTASTIVARDASGNFSAGTITAALNGNASTATTASNVNNGTLTMNVSGTGLSGSQTFTANQAGNATFTVTSNATNTNTASAIVARDASGNFSAGTITAALNGNASTATSATTAGTITSQANSATITATSANTANQIVLRDGSGNFSAGTITASLNGNASTATTAANVNNGTLTMNVSGTGLSGSQTFTANQSGNATFTVTSNATSANTTNAIVARDSNGDFQTGSVNTTRALTDVSGTNSSLRVVNPGGAAFYNSANNGAIQIQLPAAATNTMFRMRVAVWTYDGQSFDICCGAYIYSGGIANQFAYMMTGSRAALNTRWGWDGSRHSFFIGNIGDFWSYPVVSVTDVQAGFSNYAASNWQSGWTVTVNNSSYGTVLAGPTLTTLLATTATTATNLAGGSAGTIPYQSAAGTTVQLAAGSSGQFLRSNGAAAPSWVAAPTTTPAGSNQQIQFNNGGSFGASSNLTFNGATLSVSGLSVGPGAGSGLQNTALGISVLANATSAAVYNTGVGYQALNAVSSGDANTAIGWNALTATNTGLYNTAVGASALQNQQTANFNTAVGYQALASTTGGENVALGAYAGDGTTSGSSNVFVGSSSGNFSGGGSTPSQCTFIGAVTGFGLFLTGTNNTCLGYNARPSTSSVSNTITLGNSSITTLRCQVTTITSLSDARDKKDVQPLTEGLRLMRTVEPVRFVWNMRDGGQVGNADTGFIAQQLQQAQITADVAVPGLVYEENPDELEAGYGKLLPFAIGAIKQLDATVEELRAQLAELKAELNTLKGK
jgi:hypothetical protein